jgi:hypothetical protein
LAAVSAVARTQSSALHLIQFGFARIPFEQAEHLFAGVNEFILGVRAA